VAAVGVVVLRLDEDAEDPSGVGGRLRQTGPGVDAEVVAGGGADLRRDVGESSSDPADAHLGLRPVQLEIVGESDPAPPAPRR
jgi:hypothetical protein